MSAFSPESGLQTDEVDFDYSKSLASRALAEMETRLIPHSPQNYAVWYSHVSGRASQLSKTIEIVASNNRRFDATINRDLYLAFLGETGSGQGTAKDMSERLGAVAQQLASVLDRAASDGRSQANAIGALGDDRAAGGADVQAIARKLMQEITHAVERTTSLEGQLAAAAGELGKVRSAMAEAEKRSKTDPLTGLANRAGLEDFLRTALIAAMEHDDPVSILLLDIDRFKSFNDTYGHQVGDQVIRLLGSVLVENARPEDLAARYGGEELILVMPGIELQRAVAAAETIREAVASRKITRRSTGEVMAQMTVSVGVGQYRLGEPVQDCIERCDQALYLAKRSGRNCVRTEHDL